MTRKAVSGWNRVSCVSRAETLDDSKESPVDHLIDAHLDYRPISGAAGFQLSNPCVTAVVALLSSLQIVQEAGIEKLRTKSIRLTGYLALLLREDACLARHLQILTPMNPVHRGCQLSLCVEGMSIEQLQSELLSAGIVVDIREPDVIRVSPVPLYNTFHDVWTFFSELRSILGRGFP
jgi:kynureninase